MIWDLCPTFGILAYFYVILYHFPVKPQTASSHVDNTYRWSLFTTFGWPVKQNRLLLLPKAHCGPAFLSQWQYSCCPVSCMLHIQVVLMQISFTSRALCQFFILHYFKFYVSQWPQLSWRTGFSDKFSVRKVEMYKSLNPLDSKGNYRLTWPGSTIMYMYICYIE